MKKLLILLFPITIFSQENYYDTTISRLINEKINEYRVENGLHPYIETDSLQNAVELYIKNESTKMQTTNWFHHSDLKNAEVVCYSPAAPSFVTKEDGYTQIFSADSIATGIIEAYKNSPGHNALILDKASTKFITSVYVFYHYKKGFEGWSVFTATELLDNDWDLYLSYENLESK